MMYIHAFIYVYVKVCLNTEHISVTPRSIRCLNTVGEGKMNWARIAAVSASDGRLFSVQIVPIYSMLREDRKGDFPDTCPVPKYAIFAQKIASVRIVLESDHRCGEIVCRFVAFFSLSRKCT